MCMRMHVEVRLLYWAWQKDCIFFATPGRKPQPNPSGSKDMMALRGSTPLLGMARRVFQFIVRPRGEITPFFCFYI